MEENEAFTTWCLTEPSTVMLDGKPVPLLTVFLYRVCAGDTVRYYRGLDILQAAFEAGQGKKDKQE